MAGRTDAVSAPESGDSGGTDGANAAGLPLSEPGVDRAGLRIPYSHAVGHREDAGGMIEDMVTRAVSVAEGVMDREYVVDLHLQIEGMPG